MERRALTPSGFGLELDKLNLGEIDGLRSSLVEAFHESGGLLLVRDQGHLTPRQLLDFAALFGELELNEKYDPDFLLPGVPEILRIGNLKEKGTYRSLFTQADPPPLLWHSDDTFRHPQPLGSCVLSVATPPEGGETGFAGMAAAYEALPPATRARVESLRALHSYDFLNEYLRLRNPHRPPLSDELRKEMPPVERPLVAEHPVTHRKSLYIPKCHIESIAGLSDEERDALLSELLDHATSPDFALMHRWRLGDVVIWDNRSTLHAPSPFDADRYLRLLYRTTVMGEQIVGF